MIAGFGVMAGLPGTQVRQGDDGKGIRVIFERVGFYGIVEQFGNGEVEPVAAAEDVIAEVVGLPVLVLIGQDGEAGERVASIIFNAR